MLYQPPYVEGATPAVAGIHNADANAAYSNGNAVAGVEGSYVPAEAVEHVQREVLKIITAAGMTPSVADLTQAAQAIQLGALQAAIDTGGASAMDVTLALTPAGAPKFLIVKAAAAPTGATTITIATLGAFGVKMADGSALAGGEYGVNSVLLLGYDGANYRIIGGNNAAAASQAVLNQFFALTPTTYTLYVRTDGNDANDGSANSAAKAFATISAAFAYAAKNFTLGHAAITIVLGIAGTYAPAVVPAGFVNVTIEGNVASQDTYIISQPVAGAAITVGNSAVTLKGVKLKSAGAAGGPLAVTYGICTCINVTFEGAAGQTALLSASYNGTVWLGVGIKFASAASSAVYAFFGGVIEFLYGGGTTLTAVHAYGGAAFAFAAWGGIIVSSAGHTFTGTATGARYYSSQNSVIDVYGGGANVFPGNAAGTTITGGLYQ